MKHTSILILLVTIGISSFAQKITKINISNTGTTESFTIGLDENVILIVSPDGNLSNYGVDYFSEKVANYSRLENYNGRIEMYATTDDKAYQGKLKYIGRTGVTYYASYEDESLRGKIKSIGSLIFTYNQPFEDALLKGKIKSIGANQIGFYNSFDNDALRGKLKMVGATSLNYYSSFDDKAFRGKIKSIGGTSFTYYTSYDRQFAGAMKTGNQTQNINGIVFIVR
jgi:hypothetical protein